LLFNLPAGTADELEQLEPGLSGVVEQRSDKTASGI
jgi:hypothetical protein